MPPLFQWSGCCHPSIVATDTKIFHKKTPVTSIQSTTRFQACSEITGVPFKYDGYVLADPWTTPNANVSLFLGGGTAAALNKINGLAWGLMYKDLRGFCTETWRTLKPKCPPTYKSIRMYQCVRTHESKHISFVHPNQRGIERTCRSTRLLAVHAPT